MCLDVIKWCSVCCSYLIFILLDSWCEMCCILSYLGWFLCWCETFMGLFVFYLSVNSFFTCLETQGCMFCFFPLLYLVRVTCWVVLSRSNWFKECSTHQNVWIKLKMVSSLLTKAIFKYIVWLELIFISSRNNIPRCRNVPTPGETWDAESVSPWIWVGSSPARARRFPHEEPSLMRSR